MKTVIVLSGPTGSGKSGIIHDLPADFPIEIINADSRQIYKFLEIGTAIPSVKERNKFPHHLFAFLEPDASFSAGQYVNLARPLIKEITARGKIPVIVGGTFFYIKALWDGLINSPEINTETEIQVNKMPANEAYLLLKELDPDRAAQLAPADAYRIKRSLAVCLSSGRPISGLLKSGGIYSDYDFKSFYLDTDRKILYDRINLRVQRMMDTGLLKEVSKLIQMGYSEKDPAMRSIGYHEILNMSKELQIPPGQWTTDVCQKAIDAISKETRNFAKRQLTWFRNEPRLKRIDPVFAVSLLSEIILDISGEF